MVNHGAMWPLLSMYTILPVMAPYKAHKYWVVAVLKKLVLTLLEDVVGLFRTYLLIKAAIRLFMDACDQAPLRLLKMQNPKPFTLRWRSFSECDRVHVSIGFDHQGGQYIENELSGTNVNTLRLKVVYLNATINVKPKTQSRRLQPTSLAKSGKRRGLISMGPGLAHKEWAGRVFRRVWVRTDPFLGWNPGPIANTRLCQDNCQNE
jgi:hypothetical protein